MNRLGLVVILVAFFFWYGFGYVNPGVTSSIDYYAVNLSIATFVFCLVLSYSIIYRSPLKYAAEAKRQQFTPAGTKSLFFLLSTLAISLLIWKATGGKGMLGYHSLRALNAIGVLAAVYCFVFQKSKRTILIIVLIGLSLVMIGIYSRRPFLTLIAPIILTPLIRNRYRPLAVAVISTSTLAISIAALSYITGLRYIGNSVSPFSVFELTSTGLRIFAIGQGFDTIKLTDYVISIYGKVDYLSGNSFIGGILNFIPRALWEDKPIAFGISLSAQYFGVGAGNTFTNFGPGIVAEAYANGGYTSIVLVSSMLGCLVAYCDRKIEENHLNWNYVVFGVILYPALFFLIRGDFLNSFYEFYSKMAVAFIVLQLTGMSKNLRPKYHNQGSTPT